MKWQGRSYFAHASSMQTLLMGKILNDISTPLMLIKDPSRLLTLHTKDQGEMWGWHRKMVRSHMNLCQSLPSLIQYPVNFISKKNGLLHLPGWESFTRLARCQKKLISLSNQAKFQSFRAHPTYKFGIQVPRSHTDAAEPDRNNGNKKWQDTEKAELDKIDNYSTFNDLWKKQRPPPSYKHIRVHMVYDLKHDGCHQAKLVAGGHLTETPIDSVYSSVV